MSIMVVCMSYGERDTCAGGRECEETNTSFLDIFLAFFASGVMYVQASPMMPLNARERRKGTSCSKLMGWSQRVHPSGERATAHTKRGERSVR